MALLVWMIPWSDLPLLHYFTLRWIKISMVFPFWIYPENFWSNPLSHLSVPFIAIFLPLDCSSSTLSRVKTPLKQFWTPTYTSSFLWLWVMPGWWVRPAQGQVSFLDVWELPGLLQSSALVCYFFGSTRIWLKYSGSPIYHTGMQTYTFVMLVTCNWAPNLT